MPMKLRKKRSKLRFTGTGNFREDILVSLSTCLLVEYLRSLPDGHVIIENRLGTHKNASDILSDKKIAASLEIPVIIGTPTPWGRQLVYSASAVSVSEREIILDVQISIQNSEQILQDISFLLNRISVE